MALDTAQHAPGRPGPARPGSPESNGKQYRIAVDVGGTFTDVFIFDEAHGEVRVTKTPSTPDDPGQGILDGLDKGGVPLDRVLLFSHGTTVGTNALITRRLPRTAMVTTKGFRDVLEIRRSTKEDLWDAYQDVAPPYVRRRDRLEVAERIDYRGEVVTPLDEEEARRVATILRKRRVSAVAVCFMNSYANPAHELRMKEILQEALPEAFICTSAEILPEIFEHERFSTTVINAALGPVAGNYLKKLTGRLREKGYAGEVLVLHSGGGVMTADTVAERASRIASSGIAAGAISSAYIAKLCGFQNAIGLDMGGTSADISLMYDGELRVTKEWQVEYGYPILYPSIEIITIGAGGGSEAWIDQGGSLRNGPQSAGADPGPACYRRGGTEPTNTDANLLLGRLSPKILGGAMELDVQAAEAAVRKIAEPFGFRTEEAANAIIQVANANMYDALKLISVRRGYDPREFALVAFGGAGALHAAHLAREMEIPTVIVPPFPGITSAMGCLLVDVQHDLSKTYLADAAAADVAALEDQFRALEQQGMELLAAEYTAPEHVQLLRFLDMRYAGQWRALTIPAGRPLESLEAAVETFHAEHQREYAFSNPQGAVQIYGLRVKAVGAVPKPGLKKHPLRVGAEPTAAGTRPVYFAEAGGYVATPIYDRPTLPPGATLTGPAIVEQLDSTVVIPPGVEARVDEYLNLILDVRP
ncbi:MAG: hydantoinase/oxoprolinase family protein [Deferrisomatales bacterium]